MANKAKLPAQNGIILLAQNPVGAAEPTAYDPKNSAIIIAHEDAIITGQSNWTLDANGYAYNLNNGYALWIRVAGLPAKPGPARKYEHWFRCTDATPTPAYGSYMVFNYLDASNYWDVLIYWTGSLWTVRLEERTAGVTTTRYQQNYGSAIDWPCDFHCMVWDVGDTVIVQVGMYEVDVPADDQLLSITYYQASRNNKTNTGFAFNQLSAAGQSEALLVGCQVTDIL